MACHLQEVSSKKKEGKSDKTRLLGNFYQPFSQANLEIFMHSLQIDEIKRRLISVKEKDVLFLAECPIV